MHRLIVVQGHRNGRWRFNDRVRVAAPEADTYALDLAAEALGAAKDAGATLDIALFDTQLAMHAYRVPPAISGARYAATPRRGGNGITCRITSRIFTRGNRFRRRSTISGSLSSPRRW